MIKTSTSIRLGLPKGCYNLIPFLMKNPFLEFWLSLSGLIGQFSERYSMELLTSSSGVNSSSSASRLSKLSVALGVSLVVNPGSFSSSFLYDLDFSSELSF